MNEYYKLGESFKNKHKECVFHSSIGGKFTYLITPTGFGDIIEIQCNSCGEKECLTNFDNE